MRRKNNEITDRKKIDEIIKSCQVCRLAVSLNDNPYLIPVSFGYDGDNLYFHTATTGKKIDYFEQNNKVCFEFDRNGRLVSGERACDWTWHYESVIGFGTIHELVKPADKEFGLNHIMQHYSGKDSWEYSEKDLERTRVWQIRIDSITGKYLAR